MDAYSYISNADVSYIDDLYQKYRQDADAVDVSWQRFFQGFEFSQQFAENGNGNGHVETADAPARTQVGTIDDKEILVRALIHAYRTRGHLRSKTNPIRERRDRKALLDLADFNLSEADLDTKFQAGEEIGIGQATLRDIQKALKSIYEGAIGFEYMYIREPDVLEWFKQKVEHDSLAFDPSVEYKKRILEKLNEAVVFENFLHTKFIGQKRFSLEGGETTIPALDAIINKGSELGVQELVIGMAHRGRLNVLANVMGKTYENIFNEFEGKAEPDLTFGDGDVKYHLGYSSEIDATSGNKINVKLAPNPSHLEAVDPVVIGYVRAKGEALYGGDYRNVLPVLIHGDAAIAGQGIVYETTQMSKLNGYQVGGTLHFVINNQVGFTTDFDDARSSIYCTDVAKIIDAPVIHVNGDKPEAVVFAVQIATEYRQKFGRDVFVDMVCYRRHGHNESDEPKFTQPNLYNIIAKHPNPREVYHKKLVEQDEVSAKLAKEMDQSFRKLLQDRLDLVKQNPLPYKYQPLENEWRNLRRSEPQDFDASPETAIDDALVRRVGEALTRLPDGFRPLKQVDKLLKERQKMFFEDGALNWAGGELLAYGSLLAEGKMVRLAGQDVQRGTFSHRHAVLHDAKTSEEYHSLNHVQEEQEPLRIFNSLLSEYAALGFEFGFAMANPNALTIWEAQFGDFANGAQVMIDQFVTSTESKWQRMNGLVMLLPHGYEGQGPEHSNARPERYLQLAAEHNIVVANVTQPANFFHLLRRQIYWPFRKPCVVMSPKSLLRNPKVVSPISDFTQGGFREVIGDEYASKRSVKRVLLCSGKVYFDLLEAQQQQKRKDVAVVRLEQLHPFPYAQLDAVLKGYNKKAELVWVQEEPENMGAWTYILRIFYHRDQSVRVVARKASASPATGYMKVHLKEQEELITRAFDV